MRANKLFALIIFLLLLSASSLNAAANTNTNAELVNQPAYYNMNFYVYKPANLPSEFYSTFDGYIVYRGDHGVWYYASSEKNGITKTGYVVGSVIPDVVRLKPYNAKISSVAPIYESKPAGVQVPRIVYLPPTNINLRPEGYKPVQLNAVTQSRMTQDANFMSISKWHNTIDRIGIIERPKIPVAWKGDYPEVIYVWTGNRWRELFPRGTDKGALATMRREIYNLTVDANKSGAIFWSDEDTASLSQYAAMWGYQWLGVINPGRR